MKILITGVAGFIGYNFCNYLLGKTIIKFMALIILIITMT